MGLQIKRKEKRCFDSFVKGETNILISTLSIFAEGIDIPGFGNRN